MNAEVDAPAFLGELSPVFGECRLDRDSRRCRRAALAVSHQTATGSRYSPKTARKTPHISPSVAYAFAHSMSAGIKLASDEPGFEERSRSFASAASTRAGSRSARVRAKRAR